MKTPHLLATGILALSMLVPCARAQEGEVRERIQQLEKKANAAKVEGREEDFARLAREIETLKAHGGGQEKNRDAQREQMHRQLEDARQKLAEATKQGHEEVAADLKRHIAKLEGELCPPGEKHQQSADVKGRIRHLKIAIENLRAAGMSEAAESLTRQAAKMHEQLERAPQQQPRSENPAKEFQLQEVIGTVHALRRTVEEMQKRIEELSRERK